MGRLKMADLNLADRKRTQGGNDRREKGRPRKRDMKMTDMKMADLS